MDQVSYETPKQMGDDTNTLRDIIAWTLDPNTITIIYSTCGTRFFYHEQMPDPEICRLIIIKCIQLPGLLDDGEWNRYIVDSGNKEFGGFPLANVFNERIRKDVGVFRYVL
jgi:hypothetical protein